MKENTGSSVVCHRHRVGFLGLLITLGIVFGDIGTSPLYVMKAILHTGETVNESTILGALSCIIWTLTLQTTIKYVCVALRADNNGEGGILALYALLRRLKNKWIYLLAIIGASTLLADGIITPAITVTTAIEGLESISPNLPVVPITLAIITIIFFVQRFGTESIGKSFGVFMLLWFLLLGVTGAFSIASCPLILKAFNPYYAATLLAKSPEWFLILGAVFLCTTGAEALYSDLGHCGRKNIAISWGFVKTMLILNYLGQGAWVLNHVPTALSVNPFFSIMPQSLLFFSIIMATGAAIVASHPALPRLLAHGGSLRTRHHHHHADDYPAARFLPAQQGSGTDFHDAVYGRILHHRSHLPDCQSVKVSCRWMVYDAHWRNPVPDDVRVGESHEDTTPLYQHQTAG